MNQIFKHEKIAESKIIDVSEIPFDEKSRRYCISDLCGEYGRTWTCPPSVGSPDECRMKVLSFNKAFVFTHKVYVDDFSDISKMDVARAETTDILFEICEKLKKKGICYQALGCGGCKICDKCTYPDSPCRFPKKAVPPVEAYCINVAGLAEKTGITYFSGENIVTFFCIILFEELK